jgi:LacI family transcriptional regulator
MAVTMRDIARDLRVSVVTVSKVIRNNPDISEETRQRVLKRIRELNYHPNLAARALVTGKTNSIGLIVPDLLHPFFTEVAEGLSCALRSKSYSVLISSSMEDPRMERQDIEAFLSRGVDAIIVASTQSTVETFRRIEEHQTPYVLIDRHLAGLTANFVGVDDVAAGRLATQHLVSVGCRRIAHIRGPAVSTALGRLEGYSQALAASHLESFSGYVVQARTGDVEAPRRGAEAMRRLLSLKTPPDGIFCYNDPVAIGAIDAILDVGLRVPEDVAVIGCGNLHYDDWLRVALSSVDQRSSTIGRRAAKLALSLIESRNPPKPRSILVDVEVVARASTQRKPACEEAHP